MNEFGAWLLYNNFNVPKNRYPTLGKYGMAFFNDKNYAVVKTNRYNMRDINSKINIISNNVVLLNSNDSILDSNIIENNAIKSLNLTTGWNLIGNIYNSKIPMNSIDAVILWVYRDGKFLGYSKYLNIQRSLIDNNLSVNDPNIYPGEGFFVYEDEDKQINLNVSTNELYVESKVTLQAVKGYDENNTYYVFKNNIWQKPLEIYPFEVIYKGE